MTELHTPLGKLRLSDEVQQPKQDQPPSDHGQVHIQPASLMGLSSEILALICSYAMIHPGSERQNIDKVFAFPQGVISERINDELRLLLRPFRCHPRLYYIARREFLEVNLAVLNAADLKASAGMLLPTSPSPRNAIGLLKSLVNMQCHISVSDLRAPFTQRFNHLHVDVLNMDRECEQLRRMPLLCPNLKTIHIYLKIDEWYLMPTGPEIRRVPGRVMTEREVRYRERAVTVVGLLKGGVLGDGVTVSVGFHHWRRGGEVLDLREREIGEVLDAVLGRTVGETWDAPVARVR